VEKINGTRYTCTIDTNKSRESVNEIKGKK